MPNSECEVLYPGDVYVYTHSEENRFVSIAWVVVGLKSSERAESLFLVAGSESVIEVETPWFWFSRDSEQGRAIRFCDA
jgi:hypothetical protein